MAAANDTKTVPLFILKCRSCYELLAVAGQSLDCRPCPFMTPSSFLHAVLTGAAEP
jgi:hypothetical protein